MALYEKRDDVYCGSCGHFTRHYIWRDGRQARNAPNGCFLPLSLGHCAHPRMKDRREDQSCPLWIPRTPDQDLSLIHISSRGVIPPAWPVECHR